MLSRLEFFHDVPLVYRGKKLVQFKAWMMMMIMMMVFVSSPSFRYTLCRFLDRKGGHAKLNTTSFRGILAANFVVSKL